MRMNTATGRVCAYTGAALLLFAQSDLYAQGKSVGAIYGSRDPATCAAMTAPTNGPPSSAQAQQYVQCVMEVGGAGNTQYLLQNVTVQVAARSRPYNPRAPIADVDPQQPVYDIRGSYVKYQCEPVYRSASGSNVGKNCVTYAHPKAAGLCWKTTFGDWGCSMVDPTGTSSINQKRDQAPPR